MTSSSPSPAAPASPDRPRQFDLTEIAEAGACLRAGNVLAYPTEAVFGLGADPLNEAAVARIFALKGRPSTVGVLLVASRFEQIAHLIDPANIPPDAMNAVTATWPGPTTWVFPRSKQVPAWVSGGHDGIALRITAHAPTAALCDAFGGALVSTSANLHGEPPARDVETVRKYFGSALDALLDAPLGTQTRSSAIRDVLTGKWLRT